MQSICYSACSLYMFRVSSKPIIRSIQICNYILRYWSYFLCSCLPSTRPSLATLEGGSCTVPEAVVTVLCTPDDGCGWHPKHVEWTCRIINRLLCVASRWTVINKIQKHVFSLRVNQIRLLQIVKNFGNRFRLCLWITGVPTPFHCTIIPNRDSIFTLNHNLYYTLRHRRRVAVLFSYHQRMPCQKRVLR